MSVPRIPLELQELIIDLVDDDFDYRNVKGTLYSCALTCRAWVPRARGRLYHTLHLEGVIGTSLNTLVDILEHTTDVSRGVRELWISDKHYDWADPALDVATILLILARKLPRLVSLTIHRAMVTSSPTRVPELFAFPALTTLRFTHTDFTSYVAFLRMLAAAQGLKRLEVGMNVTWNTTRISPIIQYTQLRCPPLTHQLWERQYRSPMASGLALSFFLHNDNVHKSLEYLCLRVLTSDLIDEFIACVAPSGLHKLCNLSHLRLHLTSPESVINIRGDTTPRLVASLVRLLAALWFPGSDAGQRKLEIRWHYLRAPNRELSWVEKNPPVSPRPGAAKQSSLENTSESKDDMLEYFLQIMEKVSAELERALVAPARGALDTVDFVFVDLRRCQQETVHDFLVSLRLRMASILPKLHQRGLLSVNFRSEHGELRRCKWMEDGKGDFEAIKWSYGTDDENFE